MFLETIDENKNNLIIFSENNLNIDKNFKIINLEESGNIVHRISFKEVCKIVTNKAPKNIILYRLLTNIQALQLQSSIYGLFVYLNAQLELFYTDPAYAIKELEFFIQQFNPVNLKFLIQQVGLNSQKDTNGYSNYTEVFQFNLSVSESTSVNDRTFVESILLSNEIRSLKNAKQTKSNTDERMKKVEGHEKTPQIKTKPVYQVSNIEVEKRSSQEENKITIGEKLITEIEKQNKEAILAERSKFNTMDSVKFKRNSVLDIFKSSDSLNNYLNKKK